jgi:hypothetical protein
MLVLKVNYGINKSNENLMALTEQHITQDCKYFKNVCFLCTAILVTLYVMLFILFSVDIQC